MEENPFYNVFDDPSNWSQQQQRWMFHSYDNFANGGALYQALAPGEAQYSEWSQQMVATMYQNWYNSASEQMARAKAAGINPFVAASGIAGNGSGSVASAPAPVNNSALPQMIGSAASMLGAAGSSFGAVAHGISELSKLRHEIKNIDQNTESEFVKMGFTELQSKAMSIQLKYLDDKEKLGVWQALASFHKTKAEYGNLLAQHNNILAQYDEIIAHKDLMVQEIGEVAAREAYEKALKSKVKEETRWQKLENDFFEIHGYKAGSPLFEGLRDKMVSEGTFDMLSFGDVVSNYNGQITSVVEAAKARASWNYRPSNATEAAAYIGTHLGTALRDLILSSNDVTSWSELSLKLRNNAAASREFNDAYLDARESLEDEYRAKRRYYNRIKRGGNSQEVSRAFNAMNAAKAELDSFTKEKFGNELIKQISPK